MKHCPNPECPFLQDMGRIAEYEDHVERCADCGTPLALGPAPAPPKQRKQSLPDLVVIASVSQPIEADLIKARLEADGIPVFLKDYETINANWLYSNLLGGVKIVVREDDAARAKQILDEVK